MSSCHSRPWRAWVVRPLASGLRRAVTGVLPSHRIRDFLSINDGGWILACAGMTAGWIPRPFIPGSALPPRRLFPTPLCHLDRLFQTRSTAYIPVGVHPCRRASMQASFCLNNTPRLPRPRPDHAAGAGQAVQCDDQAEAKQQHNDRIQELLIVMIRPIRR